VARSFALVGENGAGKSTIKNIIGGTLRPDSGHVSFGGVPAHRVGDARHSGVATVHQETSLFPDLTVAENVHHRSASVPGPCDDPPATAAARRRSGATSSSAPASVRRSSSVTCPRGQRQLVEIAKALAADPRAIVFGRADTRR